MIPKPTRPPKAPRKPLARTSRPKRGKAPRKQRKTSLAKLGRQADKLWSLIVRSRGACEVCEKMPPAVVLQGAHGFSRRYRATRWDTMNGFCLCSGCHVRYTHDPLGWDEYLQTAWGESVYETMREVAMNRNGNKPNLELIVSALQAEYERCGGGR